MSQPIAFLTYGFRPFFLLAGLFAIAALGMLLAGLMLGAWPAEAPPLGRWHGHEMLFGFVAAAIAGFLLTAAPTWTNSAPVTGMPLAGLAVLWLAGRIAMLPWLGLQHTPFVLLEAAFLPALAVTVGVPLVRAGSYRNWPFVVILALLTAADLAFLGAQLGWIAPLPFDPLRAAANLVQLMIGVIGSRIIPLFTRNALLKKGVKVTIATRPWLDGASLAVLVAVIIVDLARPESRPAGAVAALAAVLLAARLAHWHAHRALRMPIVWILHAGYAWLVASLALKAAWLLGGAVWGFYWLHALTAGAFGTMVLGVMTRVALGHSGRPLEVATPIVIAYFLVIAGAVLRVAVPALLPSYYFAVLVAAASCWATGFAIFVFIYAPILVAPRANRA